MKFVGIVLVGLFSISLLHADSAEQRQLSQYLAVEQRVETACRRDVQSELCQVWLLGVQQGVEAVAVQTEQLSARWAAVHERAVEASAEKATSRQSSAWLTRDVLNAASCSPDALAFVSSFRFHDGERWSSGRDHVARVCGSIWSQQRLDPRHGSQVTTTDY